MAKFTYHLSVAASQLMISSSASAQYLLPPPEAGMWVNEDPHTRGITQVELTFSNGFKSTKPPLQLTQFYGVHLWGSCSPTDCDWGHVNAQYSSSTGYTAEYLQSFATREVTAKVITTQDDRLWLQVSTDFLNPEREDYVMSGWFIRQ